MKRIDNDKIAIVGMAAWYPGARNPLELWENVLSQRVQFRRIPDERFPLSEYYDSDENAKDKTYANRVAVIDGYEFDWVGKRIPRQTYNATDTVQWLALDVTLQMLIDANIDISSLPKETTAVILGNTLVGDTSRSKYFRLRWPFVRKSLRTTAKHAGMDSLEIKKLEESMERVFKSVFPDVNEDTIAGGLANTIAGRVCNYLDLKGGGYIVDGACASSLIAISTAAEQLLSGDLDFAIAGGVDMSLDTFELIGFAKAGALSKSEMRVYDKRGDGFIPGEGCGIIGLKRLSDAKRDGNKIYATLEGWGISSDGKSGIATPTVEGQVLALERAFAKANLDPSELDFIEGHGTGTKVGDYIELTAMAEALNKHHPLEESSCGVTSFKTIVGHTKAASGIGGVIKTVIALNQRVLPPLANCQIPHGLFSTKAKSLYPIIEGEVKSKELKMKAGVSSMGFGGINSHVVLASADAPYAHLKTPIDEKALFVSSQDSEVFIFSAASQSELKAKIAALADDVEQASYAEMADLAKYLTLSTDREDTIKAAVVISSPLQGVELLRELLNVLTLNTFVNISYRDPKNEIFISHNVRDKTVAFVFPGQGSQQINGAKKLVKRYPWAQAILDEAVDVFAAYSCEGIIDIIFKFMDKVSTDADIKACTELLKNTEIAQPAIVLTSVIWYEYMLRAGIVPNAVAGHSLGELTAFYAAGCLTVKEVIELAVLRGKLMASSNTESGSMASIMCDSDKAAALIKKITKGNLEVANLNSPKQTVVSGDKEAIVELVELALAEGVRAIELAVSNAFHSTMMSTAAKAFKEKFPLSPEIKCLDKIVISSVDGQSIEMTLDMQEHFSQQIVKPVDFIATSKALASAADVIVEVGPGGVLSNLIKANIGEGRAYPVATNADTFKDINVTLAMLFISGFDIKWEELYENRLIRPFIPARELYFVTNPCEYPFSEESIAAIEPLSAHNSDVSDLFTDIPSEQLNAYFKQRKNFISDVIKSDIKTFPEIKLTDVLRNDTLASGVPVEISVSDTTSTLELLLKLATEMTGFPRESLNGSMHLLDDLNFDSIKAGELIFAAATQLHITNEVDPVMLAGSPIEGIARYLDTLLPEIKTQPPCNTEATSTLELLLKLATEMTGFPRESLNGSMHLLDDLNFDSIKAGELIFAAATQLHITKEVDPVMLAGSPIEGIARYLDTLLPETAVQPTNIIPPPEPLDERWVREFILKNVPCDIDKESLALNETLMQNAFDTDIAIMHDDTQSKLAKSIADTLKTYGIKSELCDFGDYSGQSKHIIALLPKPDNKDTFETASIKKALNQLKAPIKPNLKSVTYIQFNSVLFEHSKEPAQLQSSCAASYAASAHFEQPALRIRVINFDSQVSFNTCTEALLYEHLSDEKYIFASYDKNAQRYVNKPVVLETQLEPKRNYVLGKDDVILVTGGAKGITAECALALAQSSGATMALVGSSPFPEDADPSNEIVQTLQRFTENNIAHRYYSCDMGDLHAVEHLVESIDKELGSITAIVHGAGINKPSRTGQLGAEEAYLEVAPKVAGMMHLCTVLEKKPPKLMIGLSSVIGMTGMPGNSLYAFSNEALDVVLRNFERLHPETEVISIAYSVWADVGMGAKMGSTKYLEKMGIFAIPLKEAVERFLRLVEYKPHEKLVAVSAQLGGLDTWEQAIPAQPKANRYLEDIISYQPMIEVVARAHITLSDDKYIQDHRYRRVYLFPTVFGLEAMAQCGAFVLGRASLEEVMFENIALDKPIIVDPEKGIDIFIKASVLERKSLDEAQKVHVVICTDVNGFADPAFSAVIILGIDNTPVDQSFKTPTDDLGIEPLEELYGHQLFQGAMFQRIERVYTMDSINSLSQVHYGKPVSAFSEKYSSELILGDPCFRDAMLQSPQLTEEAACLPVGISHLKIYPNTKNDFYYVRSKVVVRSDKEMQCAVEALSDNGEIIESITGYHLKKINNGARFQPPEDFAHPGAKDRAIFEEKLQQLVEDFHVQLPAVVLRYEPKIIGLSKDKRHDLERPFFTEAIHILKGTETGNPTIGWDLSGKPSADELYLSLSHNQAHILCTAGDEAQGCDIETVEDRSESLWGALLGEQKRLLSLLVEEGDTMSQAGTRLWTLLESCLKAYGVKPESITIEGRHDNGVLFTADAGKEQIAILTFPLVLTRNREKMVALSVVKDAKSMKKSEHSPVQEAKGDVAKSYYIRTGMSGQLQQCYRFMVSFKDATMLLKLVNYSMFAFWMGKVRESALQSIGEQLIGDSSSGDYAWVTNYSNINILGHVTSFDVIEGRTWTSKRFGSKNSSNVLHFDWVKIDVEGREERVAYCEMGTTWVRIKDHGVVESESYPHYLEDFMVGIEPLHTTLKEIIKDPLQEAFRDLKLSGRMLYKAKEGPIVDPLLYAEMLQTTLEHSNLIGNIYFAHYYEWQKMVIDKYLYSIIPEYYRGTGEKGELFALHSEVNHLREAMPFNTIKITMHLKLLHENGVEFYFNYYALSDNNDWYKLAYGVYRGVWLIKKDGSFIQTVLPAKMIESLEHKALQLTSVKEMMS